MAETVSFKVYMSSDEDAKQEVRRFGVDQDVVTNSLYLREKLQNIFPELRGKHFTISWKDEDGDNVIISSDEELQIALNETALSNVRKLYVILHSDHEKIHYRDELSSKDAVYHHGIICDGCDKTVQGFRYKCLQCPDYDLCSKCEGQKLHEEHCMLRLTAPVQWKPHYGKRLAHHMNRFVRYATSHAATCAKDDETPKFSFAKDNKNESKTSRDGKNYSKRHGRHQCSDNAGPSWIDTFATYLNDWANLPGECPIRGNLTVPTDSTDKKNEASKTTDSHVELLKMIGENLSQFLDPLGINVNFQVKTGNSTEDVPVTDTNKGEAKTFGDNSKPEDTSNKKKNDNEEKKSDNLEKVKEKSSSPAHSLSSEGSVDGKSTENEGWTMILPSSSTNGAITKTTVPTAPAVAEESAISASLYPELPKQDEKLPYHPNSVIQKSVESMMQMGFGNERGWLTNLLISKNGDISKALDALQPVQRN